MGWWQAAGDMSVRTKPSALEAKPPEALYAQVRADEATGRATLRLQAGVV